MRKIVLVICLAMVLAGCITTKPKPNPILTSKDESWFIPAGTEFQAVKKEGEPLKTYKAEDWLYVLYKGSYLEVEKKANSCSR